MFDSSFSNKTGL